MCRRSRRWWIARSTDAGVEARDLDGIAVTAAPGLVGALLVGVMYGKTLAWRLDLPLIGVHHLEGHLFAATLEDPTVSPPFVALLVSGGHTMLLDVPAWGQYRLLGQTIDDAAGEAFDKVAKLLGLGYPGGPQIERLAREGRAGTVQVSPPDAAGDGPPGRAAVRLLLQRAQDRGAARGAAEHGPRRATAPTWRSRSRTPRSTCWSRRRRTRSTRWATRPW